MHNLSEFTALFSVLISLLAFILSWNNSRNSIIDKARMLEQKAYIKQELEKFKIETYKDINNIGSKVNKIDVKITLLEYIATELKHCKFTVKEEEENQDE